MLNVKVIGAERVRSEFLELQIKLPVPTCWAELICDLVDGSKWKSEASSRALNITIESDCA